MKGLFQSALLGCVTLAAGRAAAAGYAWADNPEGCNLYNTAGLPASPFRTDDWPLP